MKDIYLAIYLTEIYYVECTKEKSKVQNKINDLFKAEKMSWDLNRDFAKARNCTLVWRIFKKLKIYLTYAPGIPLLGICSKVLVSCSTNTCSDMFIVYLFIIATKFKPKCFSTTERIMKA